MTQRVESAVPENERDDVRLLGLEKIQKENLRKGGGVRMFLEALATMFASTPTIVQNSKSKLVT